MKKRLLGVCILYTHSSSEVKIIPHKSAHYYITFKNLFNKPWDIFQGKSGAQGKSCKVTAGSGTLKLPDFCTTLFGLQVKASQKKAK